MKRFIDANPSDFRASTPADLKTAIMLSEGRVVVAEVIAIAPPLLDKVSNVELAAAFGADLILLNMYDVTSPSVMGLPPCTAERQTAKGGFGRFSRGEGCTLCTVKDWIGRPVGLNLEPIKDPEGKVEHGRLATPENAQLAVEQGVDLLVITGNPATGVSCEGIARSVREIRGAIQDSALIFAGKIHGAGLQEPVVTETDLEAYKEQGADGVVLPAPGTIPGMTVDVVRAFVEYAHRLDALVISAIGTSQEGASRSTIEQIALMSKMTGADMHHIGDAGTIGIAVPENIYAFSMALRGRRHTWHRMAASLQR
jgi:hypothetical protein